MLGTHFEKKVKDGFRRNGCGEKNRSRRYRLIDINNNRNIATQKSRTEHRVEKTYFMKTCLKVIIIIIITTNNDDDDDVDDYLYYLILELSCSLVSFKLVTVRN